MQPSDISIAKLVAWISERRKLVSVGLFGLGLSAVSSIGIAQASAYFSLTAPRLAVPQVASVTAEPALSTPAVDPGPAWEGRDLDGDGAPDFANPTGAAPRGHDAFGDGFFHARRDGGSRPHEGVDYAARPGQEVEAPISGYVTRIGYAYPGDERFRYVEIENPALSLHARVFYVDPEIQVGQSVSLGSPIGTAHSLQSRYAGITDHIHLELERGGRKIDAQTVILARRSDTAVMAAMN